MVLRTSKQLRSIAAKCFVVRVTEKIPEQYVREKEGNVRGDITRVSSSRMDFLVRWTFQRTTWQMHKYYSIGRERDWQRGMGMAVAHSNRWETNRDTCGFFWVLAGMWLCYAVADRRAELLDAPITIYIEFILFLRRTLRPVSSSMQKCFHTFPSNLIMTCPSPLIQ